LPGAFPEAGAGTATMSVPHDWWALYSDPTLNDLVAAGLANNSDVQVAAARVEEAEAALREARATLFFPLVNGQASAFRGRDSDTSFVTASGFGVGLATSFEVDLWGRLRRAERSVRDQLLSSRYGRDTVALTLAATIARTYFAALSLDTQYAASEESVRAANESL